MIPLIIAAAGAVVGGGVAYALSDDKKSDGQWHEEITTRVIHESELPPRIRRKIEMQSQGLISEEDLFAELEMEFDGEDVDVQQRILSENNLPDSIKQKLAMKRRGSGRNFGRCRSRLLLG